MNHQGREFNLNPQNLRTACIKKVTETEEQLQYLRLTYPYEVSDINQGMEKAYYYLDQENYKLCLSQASKTKAEIDVLLSVAGVDQNNLRDLLTVKNKVIKQIIARQQLKEIFPILGYSYFEYSESLAEKDIVSALIYAEYAVEFSNIEIYLEDSQSNFQQQINTLSGLKKYLDINLDFILVFGIGIIAGVLLASRNNGNF